MTTNERLYAAGLIDEFDRARSARDLETVRQILESVYVDELSIARILAGLG
jgi:hypothetical protein